MPTKEILKFCIEKGLLIDKNFLEFLVENTDLESAKLIIENLKGYNNKKIITKKCFEESKEKVCEFLFQLPEENQKKFEKLKIKLGLTLEISRELEEIHHEKQKDILFQEFSPINVKVLDMPFSIGKKLEVKDFVVHFKNRFSEMSSILQEHSELVNPISIGKLSNSNSNVSILGIVINKSITKNKNILFDVEDLTGKIKVLVNGDKKDLFERAENICLDSILGFRVSGNREILFANDLVFPDSFLQQKKTSPYNESVAFLGDFHYGSKRFLENDFLSFIDFLNGKDKKDGEESSKIKYLFVVGDLVTGIGNYPNQEKDLKIKDLEEQFQGLAEFFKKIRKDIQIIISPGNHDGVRIMEPQPVLDEKYAWPLYDLKNIIFTTNPARINIGSDEKKTFNGFDVLTYHGFSFPFYANNISELVKKRAMDCPEEIMKYLLRQRHLAPTHASVQYFPLEQDPLLIKKTPDIFVSAHTHKSGIGYYNNTLLVSTSCWESMTPYQEKFGNKPDHCKVPIFNLKTRAIKILDFENTDDKNENN